ncbi:MAG TPA: hypothetical protein PK843_03660 [bacterium]|nr:hypothetical protein [bacterium]HPN33583.1 hypothetical protein [bacterium]
MKRLFVHYLINLILLLIMQLSGQMNALRWSVVIPHGAFTLAFGCFLKQNRSGPLPQQ